jgi:hypothetical protein
MARTYWENVPIGNFPEFPFTYWENVPIGNFPEFPFTNRSPETCDCCCTSESVVELSLFKLWVK